jgi:fluoroacetyl-CoA thioesterase
MNDSGYDLGGSDDDDDTAAPRGRRARTGPGVSLEAGLEAEHEFDVEGRLLTDVGGTLGVEVLSTPGMIAMMERTAARLVFPHLPEGKATVGFEVCVKHVAGARKGSRCVATVRLDEVVEDRKLRFSVEVLGEGGRTIGVGTHERRVVDAQPPGATA